jgi:hypothetical protein
MKKKKKKRRRTVKSRYLPFFLKVVGPFVVFDLNCVGLNCFFFFFIFFSFFFFFFSDMRFVLFLALACLAAGSGCHCDGDTCGCCVHVSWKKIGLDGDACLNLTYIPANLEIDLTLVIGPYTIINKTVSAKDPDICVGIPYIKKLASICLDFSNVTYSNHSLSGCADVRAEIIDITVAKANLGCFNLHLLAEERRRISKR